MQRRRAFPSALLLATLLAWASGCGDASVGTFVRLKFDGTLSLAAPVKTIAVDLQLGTATSSTTFQASGQGGIKLPTDAILEIGSGEGPLTVFARALAADGVVLGTGVGVGTVVRDQTVVVPVLFGGGVGDASVDGADVDGPVVTGIDASLDRGLGDLPMQDTTGNDPGRLDGSLDLQNPRLDADWDAPATGGIWGSGGVGGGGAGGGGNVDSGSGGATEDTGRGGAGGVAFGTGGGGGNSAGGGSGGATGGSGGTGGSSGDAGTDVSTAVYRLTATPASLDFGVVVPGTTSPALAVTIINEGDAPSPGLVTSFPVGKGFVSTSDTCANLVLAPRATCTVTFTFTPPATGIVRVDALVAPVGKPGAKFQLSGAGAGSKPELLLTPSTADFRVVDVGTSLSIDFTLRNIGTVAAGTVNVQTAGSPFFRIENDRCAGKLLAGQEQCLFTVVFSPATFGPASTTVTAQSSLGLAANAAGNGVGRDYVTVRVLFAGNGTGIVTGPGLSCASNAGPCSIDIARTDPSAVYTMSASPSVASFFGGWSGAGCSGTGACTVNLGTPPTVTATFGLIAAQLIVTKAGNGDGTVTSEPAGINCGTSCGMKVPLGQIVTLSAAAGPGSNFTGWSGGGCSGIGTCAVTVSGATAVTANFELNTYDLKITKIGNGNGLVRSIPAGITCGTQCSAIFDYGERVTLTAEPTLHSTFSGWDGAGCSGVGECTVVVTEATMVSAKFTLDRHTLGIKKEGDGEGRVTSDPLGIACGTDCSQVFDYGTKVVLAAMPLEGSIFVGWASDVCKESVDCNLQLTADTTVNAIFRKALPCTTVSGVRGCLSTQKFDLGALDVKTCPVECGAKLQNLGISSGCWFIDDNRLSGSCWCTDGALITGGLFSGGVCK